MINYWRAHVATHTPVKLCRIHKDRDQTYLHIIIRYIPGGIIKHDETATPYSIPSEWFLPISIDRNCNESNPKLSLFEFIDMFHHRPSTFLFSKINKIFLPRKMIFSGCINLILLSFFNYPSVELFRNWRWYNYDIIIVETFT